jgi:hypothetical protein
MRLPEDMPEAANKKIAAMPMVDIVALWCTLRSPAIPDGQVEIPHLRQQQENSLLKRNAGKGFA